MAIHMTLNLLGGAASVLGLVGLYFDPHYFGLYSEPVPPSYLDLIPLFSFVGGLAVVLGANVVKRRWTRIGLAVVVIAIFTYLTIGTSSAIANAPLQNPWVLGEVHVTSAACNSSPTLECTFVLQNEGADPVQVRGAVLYGNTLPGTCDQTVINDGASTTLHCSWPGGTTESTPQYAGYVMIGNLVGSAQLPFTTG